MDFGFESSGLGVNDFTKNDAIIQLGYTPNRIDILTEISGVKFNEAFPNKVKGKIGREEVHFISAEDLLKNKKAANRIKDIADTEILEKYLKHRNDNIKK